MSHQNFDSRIFGYERQQPNDIPEDFPNPEEVFVLMDVFHSKSGPFQRLLDCSGIRYVLLLEFNKDVDNCMENDLLEKMYQAFEEAEEDIHRCRRSLHLVSKECMKMFWPHLMEDFQTRNRNGTLMDPISPLDYDRKDSNKLQLKTIEGSVCTIEHDTHLDDRNEPFETAFSGLCCFSKNEVEILETITTSVFKVRIQGEEYALRAGRPGLNRVIEKLYGKPSHPNVIGLSGAVVEEEGKIIGILTPFVSGKPLWLIPSATMSQKGKWKTKISDAVNFLHNEGIVWSSACPNNIIISSATDEPMVTNFEGGTTDEWVDEDLFGTKEGDMQALSRILKYVDDIPTNED